jgi:putative transposase
MDGSIRLRAAERKAALNVLRRGTDPELRLRAHILLLLNAGQPWTLIVAVLFTSTATINRWRKRFLRGGLDAVLSRCHRGSYRWWVYIIIMWVTERTPSNFGFVRSRWACETVAIVLREDLKIPVSRETVRRHLHAAGLVWRRPRPVPGLKDPAYPVKLGKIRKLLRELPNDEVAVFQDEVDINTNPKIGSMWMWRGQQAEVVTPCNNDKRYLAGSLNWWTGALILTEGKPNQGRNTDLFLAHLDDLRWRLRRYKVIHVICDNAKPHKAKRVQEYLKEHAGRIVIHYLPNYAPKTNPIERVWWHLHEEITRNHRAKNIEALLDLVFEWLTCRSHFRIETSIYNFEAKKASLSPKRGAI